MTLRLQILVLFSTVLLVSPNGVSADGVVYDRSSKLPLKQREQMAAIAFHDGIEKMIIAINFELDSQDDALWIFPVLGTPDQVKVDIQDEI